MRPRQTSDVGKNEGEGMTHGVDKMDTEAYSEEGKIGNLERGELGSGRGERKDHGLDER